jgi:hypothetical protein
MSQAVSRWPYKVKEWFRPMSGQTFVFTCQHIIPMFHAYVHLHVAVTRWKNGRNLGNFQKAKLFRQSGDIQ